MKPTSSALSHKQFTTNMGGSSEGMHNVIDAKDEIEMM